MTFSLGDLQRRKNQRSMAQATCDTDSTGYKMIYISRLDFGQKQLPSSRLLDMFLQPILFTLVATVTGVGTLPSYPAVVFDSTPSNLHLVNTNHPPENVTLPALNEIVCNVPAFSEHAIVSFETCDSTLSQLGGSTRDWGPNFGYLRWHAEGHGDCQIILYADNLRVQGRFSLDEVRWVAQNILERCKRHQYGGLDTLSAPGFWVGVMRDFGADGEAEMRGMVALAAAESMSLAEREVTLPSI